MCPGQEKDGRWPGVGLCVMSHLRCHCEMIVNTLMYLFFMQLGHPALSVPGPLMSNCLTVLREPPSSLKPSTQRLFWNSFFTYTRQRSFRLAGVFCGHEMSLLPH